MRSFLSRVITFRQCPIPAHYCRESSDFIAHFLKAMTPDKKDRIGRIFDILYLKKPITSFILVAFPLQSEDIFLKIHLSLTKSKFYI
jgi:hypothetical protein